MIKNTQIPVVTNAMFVGVVFDHRLTCISHINFESLNIRVLDLLRAVLAKSREADRDTKLNLNRTLIRSKIDYACMVYVSAKQSYI